MSLETCFLLPCILLLGACAAAEESEAKLALEEGTGDILPYAATETTLRGRLLLAGAKPLQELPELMNASDILLLPSRTTRSWKEQFGRVAIEAHA